MKKLFFAPVLLYNYANSTLSANLPHLSQQFNTKRQNSIGTKLCRPYHDRINISQTQYALCVKMFTLHPFKKQNKKQVRLTVDQN